MGYTRLEILKKIEESRNKMHLFYKQDFINYRGKTSDTNELYNEIICNWLIENIELLDQISMITRKKGYSIESHEGVIKNHNTNIE